jgi:hypothetical protein
MTLTVRELLIAVDSGALKRLAAQPIPAVGAWRLRRIQRAADAEYGPANIARLSLITEDNSMPLNGGPARIVRPDCMAAFEAEPLFAQTVTINCEPLTLDFITGAMISADDLEALESILH